MRPLPLPEVVDVSRVLQVYVVDAVPVPSVDGHRVQAGQPTWTVLRPEVDEISTGGQKYLPLEDGSFLTQGYAPTKHRVKLTVKTDVRKIAASIRNCAR